MRELDVAVGLGNKVNEECFVERSRRMQLALDKRTLVLFGQPDANGHLEYTREGQPVTDDVCAIAPEDHT